jgi:hypothetical protein
LALVFAFAVNFPKIFFGIATIHVIVGIVSFTIYRKRYIHLRKWNAADTVTMMMFAFIGLFSPFVLRRI